MISDIFGRNYGIRREDSGIAVADEGAPLGLANLLNFVGAGVVVTMLAGVATVTIPGGAGVIPMMGDVTGTSVASVVSRVNGATVPAAGALTPGNVLQVTGASALGYAPVNLAGGANFVSGLLPAANQAAQLLSGDATGTTAAVVVQRVNGATVPIAGALTIGNALQVIGVSALGYAPVNLAGGANFVTGVLPTGNQAAQALAGDATGTTAAVVVVRVNGATVPIAGALTIGNVLQVIGASALDYAPVNLAGGANFVTGLLPNVSQQNQVMGGDVNGTTGAAVVVKINGATVPIAGALTIGNVLQVTGASALGYAPVNLAGGANFVTGLLPTGNQAAQALAGDATGTTAAVVVVRVNGATVPIAGALTTGNVLQVTGAAALGYAPVNLAGGAGFVTGVLPTGNQASQAMAGDVTGTTAANTVVTITGSAGVATVASATSLAFASNPAASGRIRMANNTGINFRNAANSGDIAALTVDSSNIVIVGSAGANFTARLANNGGGGNTLEWEAAGTGVNGRHNGNIFFQHAISGITDIRSTNAQGISFTSSGNAYVFAGMLTVVWQGSGAHLLQLQQTITAPTWTHETHASAAGANWIWRAQGAGGASNNGGFLLQQGGARTGTGLKGGVRQQLNGTTETMIECGEIANGRRYVALARTSDVSGTQLPANTGDGVVYVANAQTPPTAAPVAGFILNGNGGVPQIRTAANNDLIIDAIPAAAANAGAGALPAAPAEFMQITLNGNVRKIPLYLA